MSFRGKYNVKAMGWNSMCFSPERQPNNKPKAEDKYKS